MKLALVLASTLFVLSAQARSHSDFPKCHDNVGDTPLFAIDQLPDADSNVVDALIHRSPLLQGAPERDSSGQVEVLATINRGAFEYKSPQLRHQKSLSEDALLEIVRKGSCDLASTGPCAVYDSGKNMIVIGTRRSYDGVTRIFSSDDFLNYGVGVNTNDALARRIKEKTSSKHVVFSRAYQGACDTFGGSDREGAVGYGRVSGGGNNRGDTGFGNDDEYSHANARHNGRQ